jgi:adenylate kinase
LASLGAAAVTACGLLTPSIAVPPAGAGPVILVLGPPGAGKTVNSQKISKRYGIPTINVADLLKQSAGWGKAGSSKIMRAPIESGDLVSDEVAIGLLEQRLAKSDSHKGFVLDGFPITPKQAEYLENVSNQRGFRQPIVLHLTVADSTATQRLLKRQRSDDKPEMIERRLSEYHTQADLVLKRYPQVITIDASESPKEVWQKIEKDLSATLANPAPSNR